MLIKICGLTNAQTAKEAILAGANYVGMIFSQISPRQVDLKLAEDITREVRSVGADVVGVFVDESLAQMEEIIYKLDLKIVQLYGDEAKSACTKLSKELQIIYVLGSRTYGSQMDNKIREVALSEQCVEVLPSNLNPKRDFLLFENCIPNETEFRYFIAGGLNNDNIKARIKEYSPAGIDLSSSVETEVAKKDINKIKQIIKTVRPERFGHFGGRYIPELLMTPLFELEKAYNTIANTEEFRHEFVDMLKNYVGRPTALTEAKNFAKEIGGNVRVFLKREDLLHTGAHKINNALGQCLIAQKMGKTRIIAETGAGQHGLATATACAKFGLECVIYMGAVDIERQAPNVAKMRLLGAKVVSVTSGSKTLKDAVNEALRDWAESYDNTHYCLGSALGPHPFPTMVADFHKVIGNEARSQFLEQVGHNPYMVIACVGGGSNAMGIFSAYLDDIEVKLVGVEAGGHGKGLGNNAARFQEGSPGILHGSYTYLLQTERGQIVNTHSISAGLDYAAVGPHHSNLFVTGRASYDSATDNEALSAFQLLTRVEGIIPALESSHALAYIMKVAKDLPKGVAVLVNLSGRGDKDLPSLLANELSHINLV